MRVRPEKERPWAPGLSTGRFIHEQQAVKVSACFSQLSEWDEEITEFTSGREPVEQPATTVVADGQAVQTRWEGGDPSW
jgi:hypothetical protein